MAIPEFIQELRQHIGTAPLWLPGVTVVVIRDIPEGASASAVPEILLVRRADNGEWTPVTGIIDPGEEVAEAAIREAKEETDLDIEIDALLGVGVVGPVTYDNGDTCTYMDTAVRAHVRGVDIPRVADDESTDVGWFSLHSLPVTQPRFRMIIGDAVAQLRHPNNYRPRMGYHKRNI